MDMACLKGYQGPEQTPGQVTQTNNTTAPPHASDSPILKSKCSLGGTCSLQFSSLQLANFFLNVLVTT